MNQQLIFQTLTNLGRAAKITCDGDKVSHYRVYRGAKRGNSFLIFYVPRTDVIDLEDCDISDAEYDSYDDLLPDELEYHVSKSAIVQAKYGKHGFTVAAQNPFGDIDFIDIHWSGRRADYTPPKPKLPKPPKKPKHA